MFYNIIPIIINWIFKMLYYKLVEVMISILYLAKVIFGIVIRYNGIFNIIISI